MKMTVTRVLAHGEGDPVVVAGGTTIAVDHGSQPQKIHQYEVWLDGPDGYVRLMLAGEATAFTEGEEMEVEIS